MRHLWFSIYDFSFDYKGNEPAFPDVHHLPWASEFELHAEKIKAELNAYLEKNSLESYFNSSMVTRKNSWRTVSLKTWAIELYKTQKEFPFTASLLKKYPSIISASFNLLEAGSSIKAHCGDTNAIYRCHLGLEIPEGLPKCGFKVKDETRAWVNGKWFAFMDAYVHEAWNHSEHGRYIFLIDVMRDEFAEKKKLVISTVRTSLFLQKRAERLKFLLRLPPWIIKAIAKTMRPFISLAISFVNYFKVY